MEPKSPADRRGQREAAKIVAQRAAWLLVPLVLVSVVVLLLGLPWWLILIAVALFTGIVLFDS
ncbi:MAG: hypothetical protein HKN26_05985 [Acidimicrobiales bacterium]|nr:hypothetical protein [Acidimicrobiales bacterium]